MRKILISLLAACAMAPAPALGQDASLRGMRPHVERPTSSDDNEDSRPRRSQSVQRVEPSSDRRPARADSIQRDVRPAPTEPVQHVERVDGDAPRIDRIERHSRQQVEQAHRPDPVQPARRTDTGRDGLVGAFSRIGGDDRTTTSDRRGDHDGDHRWSGDHDRWSGDWRRDHRYDWRSHRSRYSSLFRLGRYDDPYGWGYRRFSIGYSLYPSYYGSNYWLNDPWQYRLPPAHGPYRWVRYYDDAFLVNIYSGEVVDVLYNFFW
ncbi:MAG: RcnB family protein [Sphingomicrobium sp.]